MVASGISTIDRCVSARYSQCQQHKIQFDSDETRLVAHGDDFTFLGTSVALEEVLAHFRRWWDIKLRGILGSDPEDSKEIEILNRKLTWDGNKLILKADNKHAEVLWAELGIRENSNGISIPINEADDKGSETVLDKSEASRYRSLAARVNYLGLDRPDLQYATKKICQEMANPTASGMARLKRVARYLVNAPEGHLIYDSKVVDMSTLKVYVDSDWAGCKATRKSTSGGLAVWAGGVVKSWSRTQGTIALSSGEAEFYAALKGIAEGLGLRSLMQDMGVAVKVEVVQDSTSAKGTLSRSGIGKIKHLDTNWLWVQEVVKTRGVQLIKIDGAINPADVLTKPTSFQDVNRRMQTRAGYEVISRRGWSKESGVATVTKFLRNQGN